MLNRIKLWLVGDGGTEVIEQDPLGYRENKVENMREITAYIVSGSHGYTLVNTYGDIIHTYSRRRDALRGAQRRGLQLT